jgi:hypothetical protein
MSLPLSVTRTISLSTVSDPVAAADRLERGLEALRANHVHRTGNELRFSGSAFGVAWTSNLLQVINEGHLATEPDGTGVRVTYHLEFGRFFIVVSVFVLCSLGLLLTAPLPWDLRALFVAAMWLWWFGGSVGLTLVRFPWWIRRTAEDPRRR